MKNYLLLIVTSLLMFSSLGLADGGEGHGGDDLRTLFYRARALAEYKLKHLKACSFQGRVDESTKQWILDRRDQLAEDVLKSKHIWLSDMQTTCAFTKIHIGADIYLSFPACRNITQIEQAAELLVHETAHHFDITEEGEADRIAVAVMTSRDVDSCPEDPEDPFNPRICAGVPMTKDQALRYFEAGTTVSRVVGYSDVYHRIRSCNKFTGCKPWEITKNIIPLRVWENGGYQVKSFDFSRRANYFQIVNNNPSIMMKQLDPIFIRCDSVGDNISNCSALSSNGTEVLLSKGSAIRLSGTIKPSCAWFRHADISVISKEGNYTENELVLTSFY